MFTVQPKKWSEEWRGLNLATAKKQSLFIVAALSLALAGCGSKKTSQSEGVEPTSPAQPSLLEGKEAFHAYQWCRPYRATENGILFTRMEFLSGNENSGQILRDYLILSREGLRRFRPKNVYGWSQSSSTLTVGQVEWGTQGATLLRDYTQLLEAGSYDAKTDPFRAETFSQIPTVKVRFLSPSSSENLTAASSPTGSVSKTTSIEMVPCQALATELQAEPMESEILEMNLTQSRSAWNYLGATTKSLKPIEALWPEGHLLRLAREEWLREDQRFCRWEISGQGTSVGVLAFSDGSWHQRNFALTGTPLSGEGDRWQKVDINSLIGFEDGKRNVLIVDAKKTQDLSTVFPQDLYVNCDRADMQGFYRSNWTKVEKGLPVSFEIPPSPTEELASPVLVETDSAWGP